MSRSIFDGQCWYRVQQGLPQKEGYILNGFHDFIIAVFAPKCSQNYKNESFLVNYALSLFYESVSKSDCITRAKTSRCCAPKANSGVAGAKNLLEKSTA